MMPVTAADALKLWDSGGDVPAFRVESTGASQDDIYRFAFERIRYHLEKPDNWTVVGPFPDFSQRELDAGESVALVAIAKGWTAMVTSHIDAVHSPAIIVRKPAVAA